MPEYKQVIIYNKNSNMSFNSCLKYIVQGSLNSVDKSIKLSKIKVDNWLKSGQKKVTLQVPDASDLLSLKQLSENKKIITVLLNNNENVPCILVLGPDLENSLDPISGNLRLF